MMTLQLVKFAMRKATVNHYLTSANHRRDLILAKRPIGQKAEADRG